jgi:allantoinase
VPDVPNFAWAEYGMRVGMPRLLKLLAERDVPVGCTINAGVIDTYPGLAEAILRAGWEFIGHGLHQRALTGERSEADLIATAIAILRDFTGKPVHGWLGPGLRETTDTPDHLARSTPSRRSPPTRCWCGRVEVSRCWRAKLQRQGAPAC